jgi:hypothetical protein
MDVVAPVAHKVTATDLIPLIRAWRLNEIKPVPCPCCTGGELEIFDRSARPYREWYAVSCRSCGMEKTVALSLAAAIPGAD